MSGSSIVHCESLRGLGRIGEKESLKIVSVVDHNTLQRGRWQGDSVGVRRGRCAWGMREDRDDVQVQRYARMGDVEARYAYVCVVQGVPARWYANRGNNRLDSVGRWGAS